jgi:hypothetical protein
MIIVYTPAGFEQSFVDQAAMLQEGKDQSEISRMLLVPLHSDFDRLNDRPHSTEAV